MSNISDVVDSSTEVNTKYFAAFYKIFKNSKHLAHFSMMMGEEMNETWKNAIEEEENGGNTAYEEVDLAIKQASAILDKEGLID